MKRLVTLVALAWTTLASAQTAGQYIAAGTNDLTLTNWWGADTNFSAALAVSLTNETANLLKAATRLLVLPQTPAGSNFLVALGFPSTNRWLPGFREAGLPEDTNHYPIFPAGYNSSNIVYFFRTNVVAAIAASLTNLAAITDTNYTLSLSSSETLIESVTVDYGDIQMLRALLAAAQVAGYTANANNLSTVMPQIDSWFETQSFTWQLALATYPNILTLQNTNDLASSKVALTNAIALYFAASDFIRNRPIGATNRLFELDTNEVANEAQFRIELTNALLSLNAPTEFKTNDASSTIYAGGWFSGTNSLNKFLPRFDGDAYVNDSLPDYTFGGILPYMPAYKIESFLRKEFYSYAGIYAGNIYDLTFGDPNAGGFAAFVSTNQLVTVVGYDVDSFQDYNGQAGGIAAQFGVDKSGNWQLVSNNLYGVLGNYSYGSIGKDGSFYGQLQFTNGDLVWLNGFQPAEQSPVGPFQNAAGYYSGTWFGTFGGQPQSGTIMAVLSADGYLIFCIFNNGTENDGGLGQFGSNNQFTTTNATSGSIVSCTLNPSTWQIVGTGSNTSGSATLTMSRTGSAPFDLPPVITKDLPLNTNVALGTNVTFSVTATGSAPLCYQWYLNGNAIPYATANTLVGSNLWTTMGTYFISATVNNAVGATNSQFCAVNVEAETMPPTIAITAPTPGQLWSNSTFIVTGTASDNVAVSNVFCAVNTTSFFSATTTNNWTNWSVVVPLLPGTNTIRAYAVDTSGNDSTTNSVTVVFALNELLVLGHSQFLTNGQFQLTVNGGTRGQNYVLLASTNLVNWTPISGFVDTNQPITIYDPNASQFRWRFYRIGPSSLMPAIRLGAASGQTNGSSGFNVVLYSLPGLSYHIDASTNFVNWTTITNFVSTNSPFYLSDPQARNYKQRFYRAVMP